MSEAIARAGWGEVRPDAHGEPARVANRIVQVLADHGVDRAFGIPGGTISPVFDALLDVGIEHITCQHESMAMYMAAGYARATGKPAVVLVTSGPGVLNAMTGLAAAYHDETPVLVLAGDVASPNEGRGALQDGSRSGMSVVKMASSITKLAASLDQPARAEALVLDALSAMRATPRGPALLRLPVDHTGAHSGMEVLNHSTRGSAKPNDETCARIADELAAARRPALFVGGAVRCAGAERALRALAEVTRCPVITDLESKGVFPESNPLSLGLFGPGSTGRAARYLEEGVDLLVTVGARLDDTTTANYSPLLQPTHGKLVQIDHDPRRLGRAYAPDVVLAGDLPTALDRIREQLPTIKAKTLLGRDIALRSSITPTLQLPPLSEAPHDPRAVIVELQRAFPEDTVFTSDIGNHLLFAGMHLRIDRPDQFHASIGLGGMTSGIGLAMGLQQAHKARRVVAICGDGGLLMGGNEIATCARYGIPVTLAVFNDGQLGMVQHGSERVYKRSHEFKTPETDLAAYARALGADAIRIETMADLADAAAPRDGRPLLLDIPIDPAARALNPRDETLNFPEAAE